MSRQSIWKSERARVGTHDDERHRESRRGGYSQPKLDALRRRLCVAVVITPDEVAGHSKCSPDAEIGRGEQHLRTRRKVGELPVPVEIAPKGPCKRSAPTVLPSNQRWNEVQESGRQPDVAQVPGRDARAERLVDRVEESIGRTAEADELIPAVRQHRGGDRAARNRRDALHTSERARLGEISECSKRVEGRSEASAREAETNH